METTLGFKVLGFRNVLFVWALFGCRRLVACVDCRKSSDGERWGYGNPEPYTRKPYEE